MLGNLVAESMRLAVHADVGVQNLGGIRADLRAGHITYGQVYEVLPFDNTVVAARGLSTAGDLANNTDHRPCPFAAHLVWY